MSRFLLFTGCASAAIVLSAVALLTAALGWKFLLVLVVAVFVVAFVLVARDLIVEWSQKHASNHQRHRIGR